LLPSFGVRGVGRWSARSWSHVSVGAVVPLPVPKCVGGREFRELVWEMIVCNVPNRESKLERIESVAVERKTRPQRARPACGRLDSRLRSGWLEGRFGSSCTWGGHRSSRPGLVGDGAREGLPSRLLRRVGLRGPVLDGLAVPPRRPFPVGRGAVRYGRLAAVL
jgi:hypothetical protein